MNTLIKSVAAATALILGAVPAMSNAATILDTGTPTNAMLPLTLDGNDYIAAEFSLGSGQTITSILGYFTAGTSNVGDTFTVSLYSADNNSVPDRRASPVWSSQASFGGNGWNGLSSLNVAALNAGKYWVAFEVNPFSDTVSALDAATPAPNSGSHPALAFAFNAGDGYTLTNNSFGVQVSAVPIPAALWLFGSGLLGLVGLRRKAYR